MPRVDWTEIRVDLKTVAAVVVTVLTGAGVFFGIKAKLDEQARLIEALRAQVEKVEQRQADQGQAIISLTVTLKTKGVIQ